MIFGVSVCLTFYFEIITDPEELAKKKRKERKKKWRKISQNKT